jgi:hypothetical protein
MRSARSSGRPTSSEPSAVSRPIHFRDVLATIYHNLGIDPHGYIRDKANRPVNILPPTSEVIRELT